MIRGSVMAQVGLKWGDATRAVEARGSRGTRTRGGTAHLSERLERPLEAAGVRLLGLRQGLEPVGDLFVAFFTRCAGHARIHVGVLVGFAGDSGFEVEVGGANGQTRRGISHALHEFQMAVRVPCLALGGGAEDRGHIVEAFDIRLLREIEVAPVCLALAGKGGLEVFEGLAVCERHRGVPSWVAFRLDAPSWALSTGAF